MLNYVLIIFDKYVKLCFINMLNYVFDKYVKLCFDNF